MARRCRLLTQLLLASVASLAERIFIDSSGDRFRVASDVAGALGANGVIRGAGGWGRLEAAKARGADAL
eukprot:CAMPEP_0197904756 /NCGR_PEP_ID=MMETSP1439-20131203/58733_1 /TAXON_ID=66791 /ORGANISM="Gonyaulax spinifera, Strain CCMP409" /LENGTH=68 /DNA_ID=CAMNT_0043525971 /DNA_START=44 /DNA_END=247 /DNA_ORIENTATION=+